MALTGLKRTSLATGVISFFFRRLVGGDQRRKCPPSWISWRLHSRGKGLKCSSVLFLSYKLLVLNVKTFTFINNKVKVQATTRCLTHSLSSSRTESVSGRRAAPRPPTTSILRQKRSKIWPQNTFLWGRPLGILGMIG